jgi:glutathione synthase/RimK-type ligase-like ATP-grasp enzyme
MPIDKTINNVYIWHSPATDVTGNKLMEALNTKGGSKKPLQKDTCMVIGWGAKTRDDINLGALPVLNHPDGIRLNRNKLDALDVMRKAKVNVAGFLTVDKVADIGKKKSGVSLPVVGRTRYHQGGKGFWHCPTMTHVNNAISEGAQYFQNLIEIRDEYRLHVFDGVVLYAAKKVKRTPEETASSYVEQELEKQKRLAEKKGKAFDEDTAKTILEQQAKAFAQNGANMLIRSNKAGWKFRRVTKYPKDIVQESVKALAALKLDFGAVDCCIDASGKAFIIEVNTGPGLEGSTLDAWVTAFKSKIAEILSPAKKFGVGKAKTVGDAKTELKRKIELMQEMAEVANDEDASVLNKVFSKMFR